MLYLLASQQATTRQDVAQLLGISRNTVGRWLSAYANGGVDALLDIYIPPGKQPSLSADVLASLEQALQRPEGFASYEALRQWLKQTHQIEVKYKTLYTIVRTRFKAKLKVPRPSHTKKPDALAEFKSSCVEELRAAIPHDNRRPIKLFTQDESRLGLLTVRRRRLTACGVQPVGSLQHRYEWFYIYGAVAPSTGESFFLLLPNLNVRNFQIFLAELAKTFADSLNLLVVDRSAVHLSKRVRLPENVRLIPLPPYCPELNPIERFWRDLKDDLAWITFSDLQTQQEHVADALAAYDPASLQSLTGYSYFVDAVHALSV